MTARSPCGSPTSEGIASEYPAEYLGGCVPVGVCRADRVITPTSEYILRRWRVVYSAAHFCASFCIGYSSMITLASIVSAH